MWGKYHDQGYQVKARMNGWKELHIWKMKGLPLVAKIFV